MMIFFVLFGLLVFGIQLLRKKATLNTPLTIPIVIFWAAGLISTIFSIVFYFTQIPGVFPHIAILNALRYIEYISLFFLAFSAVKNKKSIHLIVGAFVLSLLAVVLYGYGQRFIPAYFPAYSTMNEEFAKGIPLMLSPLGRVQSTFAGHYDLAAWLVMMIPLIGSLIFGYRQWWVKLLFFASALSGVVLLLMTASRTSFAVYLLTVIFMLIIQKQKKYIIPVIIISFLLLQSFQGLYQRYTSTISTVDLVVDARTGKPVGIAKKDAKQLTIEDIQSTGENLPQGSGYINLPSQQVQKTAGEVVYKKLSVKDGKSSTQTVNLEGNFVVKKALAYDVSFTTRFQGEWPRAIEAFKRNILLGSGYSSISLATDGNYLRILGEVGLLGFVSFFSIFLVAGIYFARIFPTITSPVAKSFMLGTTSAVAGILLNAVLIDVFSASKVAYSLWLLMGLSMGLLLLYQERKVQLLSELRKIIVSPVAILVGLLFMTFGIFSMILPNFFVADDFSWLRWVSECQLLGYANGGIPICEPAKSTLLHFFTDAGDFFYRPGTKVFFYISYALAGLNPAFYHIMSILFHFTATLAVFLISYRLLKNKIFAALSAVVFLVLSSHFETIVWASSIGHLATSMFSLLGVLFYIYWRDHKSYLSYAASLGSIFAAPLFHESGIVAPLFILVYEFIFYPYNRKQLLRYLFLVPFILQIPVYLAMREFANALWSAGDYRYNVVKLPYNLVGNTIGYVFITLIGNKVLPIYTTLRNYFRENLILSAFLLLLTLFPIIAITVSYRKKLQLSKLTIPLFAILFFCIGLAPFVGLGNISPRYTYLSSFGVVLFIGWLAREWYTRASDVQRKIGAIIGIPLVVLFSYFHITQMQLMNKDWNEAGQIAQNLLSDFSYPYGVQEHLVNPTFYFIDTPITKGHAYVFPAGLNDVLWFTFQNDNLHIYQPSSIDLALDASEGSSSARVFRFSKDGSVEQVSRLTPTPTPGVKGAQLKPTQATTQNAN